MPIDITGGKRQQIRKYTPYLEDDLHILAVGKNLDKVKDIADVKDIVKSAIEMYNKHVHNT